MYDTNKIFDDFLAYDLIPEDKREQIEQYLAELCLTCDKELNDTRHLALCLDQITSSEYILQRISNVATRARYKKISSKKPSSRE